MRHESHPSAAWQPRHFSTGALITQPGRKGGREGEKEREKERGGGEMVRKKDVTDKVTQQRVAWQTCSEEDGGDRQRGGRGDSRGEKE